MSRNNFKERTIELLRKHPEGLTILEIAKLNDAHRHTITKYIYELVGADLIGIREVSTAKLCFLKRENFMPTRQEIKKGIQIQDTSEESPSKEIPSKLDEEDSNEA